MLSQAAKPRHLASPAERSIHPPPNETTLVCFQPRSLPAALEPSGRPVALAKALTIAIAEAHSSTAGETLADSSACAEVSSSLEDRVDGKCESVAETALNSKVLPDPQTDPGVEARRRIGQRRG